MSIIKAKQIVQFLSLIKAQAHAQAQAEERTTADIICPQSSVLFDFDFLSEKDDLVSSQQKQKSIYCLLKYKQNSYFKCLFYEFQQLLILISALGDDVKVIQNNSTEMDKCTFGLFAIVDGTEPLQYAYRGKLSQYFQLFLDIQKKQFNRRGFQKNKITVLWQTNSYFNSNQQSKQYKFTILNAKEHQKAAKIMKYKIQQSLKYTFNILKLGFNSYGDLSLTIFEKRIINDGTSIQIGKKIKQMSQSLKEYDLRQYKSSHNEQDFEQTLRLFDLLY